MSDKLITAYFSPSARQPSAKFRKTHAALVLGLLCFFGSSLPVFAATTIGTDITTEGKLGVGTTSPLSKFWLNGSYGANALAIFNETGSNDIFTASASGSPKFTINNAGRVGIGTTNPGYKLHVQDTSNAEIRLTNSTFAVGTKGILTLLSDINGFAHAQIQGIVSASNDTDIVFRTTTDGGTLIEKMRITDDGKVGIGNTDPIASLQIGSAVPTIEFPGIALVRTITSVPLGNPHGFLNQEQLNMPSNGYAYAGFDAVSQMSGTANYDHMVGFQSRPIHNSTGTLAALRGFHSQITSNAGSGVVGETVGFLVWDPLGTGPITSNYGLYVASLTRGTTNNYAIYTAGATKSYFGGNVGIGALAPNQSLEINGGVRLNTATAKPTCDANQRGTQWFTQGSAGVKDTFEVCAKDAGDAYAWRTLY